LGHAHTGGRGTEEAGREVRGEEGGNGGEERRQVGGVCEIKGRGVLPHE